MSALDAVQPAYAISGFLVGALVGLTGVGGGSLMTPLLILVFGINPAAAVGTDLLYAAVTETAEVWCTGSTKRSIGASCDGSPPAASR